MNYFFIITHLSEFYRNVDHIQYKKKNHNYTKNDANVEIKPKQLTQQSMWWWAAVRSGWWCPPTSSSPPQTWWSHRWRSQWCSPTSRSPWLPVSAGHRRNCWSASTCAWEENKKRLQSRPGGSLWRRVVMRGRFSLLSQSGLLFMQFFPSLQWHSSVSSHIRWPLCLSLGSSAVFCSLVYKLSWPFPFLTQMTERTKHVPPSPQLHKSCSCKPPFTHCLLFISAVYSLKCTK